MAADIAMHPDEPMSFEPRCPDDKASTGASRSTSPTTTTTNGNVALESSMKIWQVSACCMLIDTSGVGTGGQWPPNFIARARGAWPPQQ